MSYRCQTPGPDGKCVTYLCPVAIDQPAEEKETYTISGLEGGVDLAELSARPVQLIVEHRLQQR